MSVVPGIAGVAGLLALLVVAMFAIRRIADARGWHAELQRKIIHMGAGGLAIALPWLLPRDWQVWLLLALTLVLMTALRLGRLGDLGGLVHGVERRSWGDVLLVAAVALIFTLHEGRAILYVLPLAVLTLADAAAALAGVRYGRTFFATEDGQKSVEGSAMFFLVALILAMTCLLLLTDVPRANVLIIGVAVAGFATLVEADSWQGFDNLFLPMGVLIFLWATLDRTVPEAAISTAFILVAAALLYAATRTAGAAPHIARVNAVALFMLLGSVTPPNAILPALLLFVQAIAPGTDRSARSLCAVASLAGISFVLLAIRPMTGATAINFYALTAAALAAGWIGLAMSHLSAPMRIAAAAGTTAALGWTWVNVMRANPPETLWHGDILWPGLVAIALAGLWPALTPRAFSTRPVLRLTLLGAGPAGLLLGGLLLTRMGA